MRFVVLALLLANVSSAQAQAEYFAGGERTVGGELSFVTGDEQSSFGTGVEVLLTQTIGVTLTYARTSVEQTDRFFNDETVDVSAFSVGLQTYPSRQGLGQPITAGLGIGVGRSEGVTLFNATILVARSLEATGDGPSFQFVPKAEAALTVGLAGGTTVSAQTLAASVGIAFEVATGAILSVEPTAGATISRDETQTFLAGTVGLSFAL